ncbi:pro-FMRFamide-related neuropeptide VF isoform X1 [Nelusetta ayraudi]|uniref:pro-FMRFamide-related neuropeptide VF isoform X1 n=1 Tax=Nelusetta ayraudi TaxID=303726 RepID=UPI003F6FA389
MSIPAAVLTSLPPLLLLLLAAAAVADQQLHWEPVQDVKTPSRSHGRHNLTKRQVGKSHRGTFTSPHKAIVRRLVYFVHERKSLKETQNPSHSSRSLDPDSLRMPQATITAGRSSLPTIVRLFSPTDGPAHAHANMPLRFGRGDAGDAGGDEQHSPNLPQRFGRSRRRRLLLRLCRGCVRLKGALSVRVLRSLAQHQLPVDGAGIQSANQQRTEGLDSATTGMGTLGGLLVDQTL